jgi:hypothetical protein
MTLVDAFVIAMICRVRARRKRARDVHSRRPMASVSHPSIHALARVARAKPLPAETSPERPAGRAAWFAAGIVLGAIALATARGEFDHAMHAMRIGLAQTLRSIAHDDAAPATPVATPIVR